MCFKNLPIDFDPYASRACGVCGGIHATCAAMALEMASSVVPPPLAIIARNLGEGAELVYDHILHLFLLAGRTAIPFGAPGPYEEAVRNTPLLEEFARAEDFTGIDILGTIRSFDPCMPCTVHMAAGGRVLHRDATTCMCGDED